MNENSYRRPVRVEMTRELRGAVVLLRVQVQVQVMGLWWAVWSECAPMDDDEAMTYVMDCAEEVRDKLQESV